MLGKVTHSFSFLANSDTFLCPFFCPFFCLKGDVTNDTVSQLNLAKAVTCFPQVQKNEKSST